MHAYTFTAANGAHSVQVVEAIIATLPGVPQVSWADDGTVQAFYEDDTPNLPSQADLANAATAVAAIPAYDVWLATQTDPGHIETAVDAAAATITADTQQTVVTDSRIDLLEQQLVVALQKLADLAAYVDSQNP